MSQPRINRWRFCAMLRDRFGPLIVTLDEQDFRRRGAMRTPPKVVTDAEAAGIIDTLTDDEVRHYLINEASVDAARAVANGIRRILVGLMSNPGESWDALAERLGWNPTLKAICLAALRDPMDD